MRLHSTLGITLLSTIGTVHAAPADIIAQGSKHTLYLATCTRRDTTIPGVPDIPGLPGLSDPIHCPLIIICPKTPKRQFRQIRSSAVAYYADGPLDAGNTNSRTSTPSAIATVSEPPVAWEGTQRAAKLGLGGRGSAAGSFSSNIDAGAAKLGKGQLAGSAKMDNENFVCFTDGQTTFTGRNDLGIEEYTCTADYYCPSINVTRK